MVAEETRRPPLKNRLLPLLKNRRRRRQGQRRSK
jgi:hypothetical protein